VKTRESLFFKEHDPMATLNETSGSGRAGRSATDYDHVERATSTIGHGSGFSTLEPRR